MSQATIPPPPTVCILLTYFLNGPIADVMGVSEVLLCPYHYLEDMVNSKNSKFNFASTPGSFCFPTVSKFLGCPVFIQKYLNK